MRSQIEGSRAVAEAVARCRPEVICAYPISPQTHIVEGAQRAGAVRRARAAASTSTSSRSSPRCRWRSAPRPPGARAYTATASQGLLFMAEALYNAAGLGLPIVMTVANRAIGAPINIWNDHSDAMSQRDCGWIQLYAAVQPGGGRPARAWRSGWPRSCRVPVMVCMDGFVLTHAFEAVDVPDAGAGRRVPAAVRPRQVLDPADPVTIGAMVGPEAFTEVRYLAHRTQLRRAASAIPRLAERVRATFGRARAAAWSRRTGCADAETVVVALGSVLGTLAGRVDELRDDGRARSARSASPRSGPFPAERRPRGAARRATRVVVLERAFAVGVGGIVGADVRRRSPAGPPVHDGDRRARRPPGHRRVAAPRSFADAAGGPAGPTLTFLDLDRDLRRRGRGSA